MEVTTDSGVMETIMTTERTRFKFTFIVEIDGNDVCDAFDELCDMIRDHRMFHGVAEAQDHRRWLVGYDSDGELYGHVAAETQESFDAFNRIWAEDNTRRADKEG